MYDYWLSDVSCFLNLHRILAGFDFLGPFEWPTLDVVAKVGRNGDAVPEAKDGEQPTLYVSKGNVNCHDCQKQALKRAKSFRLRDLMIL